MFLDEHPLPPSPFPTKDVERKVRVCCEERARVAIELGQQMQKRSPNQQQQLR